MRNNRQKTDEKAALAENVIRDFEARRSARKSLELVWRLNIDFLNGNQNNHITDFDTVAAAYKQYYWQKSDVFNHISPLVESRLAKLNSALEGIRAVVVPLSDGVEDKVNAELCGKIIAAAFGKIGIADKADLANMWAEMTGTAFYKVSWDNGGGRFVGEADGRSLYEGDINVDVCSPFEIYPENLNSADISRQSIIHAKQYTAEAVKKIWGAETAGEDAEVYDFARADKGGGGILRGAVTVIERYKNGRLTVVAGGKVLFDGAYDAVPFVRQTSECMPASFFGKSVIERLIPVQRAYNAVKNRKTEFLNRIACGVLTVEDGSTDVEALENDGLAPGAIIVYRQGYQAPQFAPPACFPAELEREEERLLAEFASISGGAGVARLAESPNVSGVALDILSEQEREKMARPVASARRAIAGVAAQILRLYRKYGLAQRFERLVNGNEVQIFNWTAADISGDEIIIKEGDVNE